MAHLLGKNYSLGNFALCLFTILVVSMAGLSFWFSKFFQIFKNILILRLYISYNNIRCNTASKNLGFMATYRERERERERKREREGNKIQYFRR